MKPTGTQTVKTVLVVAVTLALTVTIVVLSRRLADQLRDEPTDLLAVGESRKLTSTPYAEDHTVLLPHRAVTLRVARPLEVVEAGHLVAESNRSGSTAELDLHADEDSTLVPVAWRVFSNGHPLDAPAKPVIIRIVAGDQSVEIDSATKLEDSWGFTSRVVALPGDLDLGDVTMEVEYDGLTQTLDVASGEIDAGVAQALYEPTQNFDTGCGGRPIHCVLAPQGKPKVVPDFPLLQTSNVTLHPHHVTHGWADDGKLWASVEVYTWADSARSADEDYIGLQKRGPTKVALDGRLPAFSRMVSRHFPGSRKAVTFEVSADAQPSTLSVRVDLRFKQGPKVTTQTQLSLRPIA